MCEFVLSPNGVKIFSVGMLAFAVSMEVLRRISSDWNRRFCETIFGPVARPHEFHSITAATWYTLALVIGVFTMPLQAIEAGALVLGAGDPIASIVGKRWGRRRIFGEKTLAGALGFFMSASLILALFLFWVMPSLGVVSLLLMTCVVALSGTLTELFSGPLEDNFTIPLVTGLVATLFILSF